MYKISFFHVYPWERLTDPLLTHEKNPEALHFNKQYLHSYT